MFQRQLLPRAVDIPRRDSHGEGKAEKNNPGWSKFGSENPPPANFPAPTPSMSFKAKGIAGSIVHAVAKTNAIVAGLIVIEAIKVLKKDVDKYISYLNHFNPISLCGMTYCLEHPSRNILFMPSEPNPYCIYEFVCLFMFPLLLEF
ncbi:unnamed protein product [Brassica oleracea var. botrytis]